MTLMYPLACGHFFCGSSTCWIESEAPAARARDGRSSAPAAINFPRCVFTLKSLFALLAHRPALELELDVAELDDVVVDEVVLLDLLVVDEASVRAVEVGDLELAAF